MTEHPPNMLPIYKINGKYYFLDKRLSEYRNVENFMDKLDFLQVGLKGLQKWTKEDTIKCDKKLKKLGMI